MRILFVTKNEHKVLEARYILSAYGVEVVRAEAPKVEIQSDSIEEIAGYSARSICEKLKPTEPYVVEDAGLFVNALNGFPGPYSEYVHRKIGIKGLLKLLEGVEDREAYFKSCVGLCWRNMVRVFVGVVEGWIADVPRGDKGFGFDPIFVPKGYGRTFAELNVEEKSAISHRGKALRLLAHWLIENLQGSSSTKVI